MIRPIAWQHHLYYIRTTSIPFFRFQFSRGKKTFVRPAMFHQKWFHCICLYNALNAAAHPQMITAPAHIYLISHSKRVISQQCVKFKNLVRFFLWHAYRVDWLNTNKYVCNVLPLPIQHATWKLKVINFNEKKEEIPKWTKTNGRINHE